MRNPLVAKLVTCAMLVAISIVLLMFIRVPLFTEFLELDIADTPILIGSFLFGPWLGLAITAVVTVIQALLFSQQSGIVGALMHFIATGAFAIVAGCIFRMGKYNNKRVIAALGYGSLTMVLVMIPLNLIFSTFFYLKLPLSQSLLDTLVILATIPSKGAGLLALLITAICTYFIITWIIKNSKKQIMKIAAFPLGLICAMLIILPINLLFSSYTVAEETRTIVKMIIPIFVPFNIIKTVLNSSLTFLLFVKLMPMLRNKLQGN